MVRVCVRLHTIVTSHMTRHDASSRASLRSNLHAYRVSARCQLGYTGRDVRL